MAKAPPQTTPEQPPKKKLYSGLYEIVEQQCNVSRIQDVLRAFKDLNEVNKKEIIIGGNKDTVVNNLREAVAHNLIPKLEVHKLIRDCEENGQQHIFYYQLRDKAPAKAISATRVATSLFGEDWGPGLFPKFERFEERVDWVDFRIGIEGKRNDWLGKLYGHECIMKFKGSHKQHVTSEGYEEVLRYKAENFNTVQVVRWNSPGLLEIRIDSEGAQLAGVIERRLAKVWELLSPALDQSDFVAWQLIDSMTTLMRDRKKNDEVYEIGTCSVFDGKHGQVDFSPYTPKETFDSEPGREQAMKELLANGALGRRLVIVWKATEDAPDELKGLRTVVTGKEFNELVVSARTTSSVLDYVTNQLRAAAATTA